MRIISPIISCVSLYFGLCKNNIMQLYDTDPGLGITLKYFFLSFIYKTTIFLRFLMSLCLFLGDGFLLYALIYISLDITFLIILLLYCKKK